jgi:hypothetical protein
MDNISYHEGVFTNVDSIPKIDNAIAESIYFKILEKKKIGISLKFTSNNAFFHNAPIHWVRAYDFVPYFKSERDGEIISSHYKPISAEGNKQTHALLSVLNSSLFYWWFIVLSNCRDLSKREIANFEFDFNNDKTIVALAEHSRSLMKFYKKNAKIITVKYKSSGTVQYEQIDSKLAKPIIDEIDKVLAQHYGFTDEELDFIINYDIKYRMGKELEMEE